MGDGRLIYYHMTDEFGEVEEGTEGLCITFKGNSVEDLRKRLEEETGLEDITVCTKSPLNGKLYPLRLQLPPNNANMNVIILPSSSKGDTFTLLLVLNLVSFRGSMIFLAWCFCLSILFNLSYNVYINQNNLRFFYMESVV